MNTSGKTFNDERPSIFALVLAFASLGFAIWSMSEKAWLGGRHELTKLDGSRVRWMHIYEPLLGLLSRTTTEIHDLATGERLIEGTIVNKFKQTQCYSARGLLAEMHIQLFPRGQYEIVILDLHSLTEIARKVLPPDKSNSVAQISSDGNSLLLVHDKIQSGQTVGYELELLKLPSLEAIDSRTVQIPINSLIREDCAFFGFSSYQELFFFGEGKLRFVPAQGIQARDSVHDLDRNGNVVVRRMPG